MAQDEYYGLDLLSIAEWIWKMTLMDFYIRSWMIFNYGQVWGVGRGNDDNLRLFSKLTAVDYFPLDYSGLGTKKKS